MNTSTLPPDSYYRSGDRKIPLTADPELVAVRYRPPQPGERIDRRGSRLFARSVPTAYISNHSIQVVRAPGALEAGAVLVADRDGAVDFAAPLLRVEGRDDDGLVIALPRVVAVFPDEMSPAAIEGAVSRFGARVVGRKEFLGNCAVLAPSAGFGPDGPVALANRLVDEGVALTASPDLVRRVEFRPVTVDARADGSAVTVDDDMPAGSDGSTTAEERDVAAERWHLDLARVQGAWQLTRGKGVNVAVLDDGVAVTHPEFSGRVRAERDFAGGGTGPGSAVPTSPIDNHGTCCAGVAVAGGIRASGSAPEAGLVAAVTPMWLGTEEEIDMFRWCVDTAGAHVISCSWGPAQPYALPDITSKVLEYCARTARGGKGVPIFFAAGNESEDMTTDGYAASEFVLAVAASTDADVAAYYSDYGAAIALCAPSSGGSRGIFTTDRPGGDGYNPGSASLGDPAGDYTNDFGGTSSATPLVAGVAALVLAVNPKLTAREVGDVLMSTADKIGDRSGYVDGHHPRYGSGRVNAERAVTKAAAMAAAAGGGSSGRPTIVGPDRLRRDDPPPTFAVGTNGLPKFAVELATDVSLFDEQRAGSLRDETNFYSSFSSEGSSTGTSYTPPVAVWQRLASADEVFYRVVAAEDDSGRGAVFSVDDGAATAPSVHIDATQTGPTSGGSVVFPSGASFSTVADPADGEDYRDPVANGVVPLVDTSGRLDESLSTNFILKEFAARSGRYRYARVSPELVAGLQRIRDDAGKPVRIRSAYRPPALNEEVGGARRSQHLVGRAVDLKIDDHSPLEMAELAFRHLGGEIGIGLGKQTIHVDLRGTFATWVYPGAELDESEFRRWARDQAELAGVPRGERMESLERDWPDVDVPETVVVGSPDLDVVIRGGNNAEYALELADDPRRFWPSATGLAHTPESFAATWERGWSVLTSPHRESVRVPAELWHRLRGDRIYVRLLTRTSHDAAFPDLESSLAYEDLERAPFIMVTRTARDVRWVDDDTARRRSRDRWANPVV